MNKKTKVMAANPFDTLSTPDEINSMVETVLQMTLDSENTNKSLYLVLDDSAKLWTLESIELNLFERLMAMAFNPDDDSKVIAYLYSSYQRLRASQRNKSSDILESLKNLIFRNVATALKEPELFAEQNFSQQFLDIYKDIECPDELARDEFLSMSIKKALEDADESMMANIKKTFYTSLLDCLKMVRQSSMVNIEKWIFTFLQGFVSDKTNPAMANIFLDFITLPAGAEGIRYAETLLGQLMCLSILPKNNQGPYEYYDNLHNTNVSALSNLSSSLWNYLSNLHESIYLFVKGFLVIGGETRDNMMSWMGSAISTNVKRGQIWNSHASSVLGNFTTAPDSFMIGLAGVLLRLCKPLMKPQLKVLNVDPTYCAVTAADTNAKQVHLKDFDKETCLIPFDEDEERITAKKYNFITEIFFMTQKAVDLSYRVCIEKFMRMNREIHRIQSAYQDAMQGGGSSDVAENIMSTLTRHSQQLLCLQNSILEPKNDELLAQFYEMTAIWVNQLAARETLNPAGEILSFSRFLII